MMIDLSCRQCRIGLRAKSDQVLSALPKRVLSVVSVLAATFLTLLLEPQLQTCGALLAQTSKPKQGKKDNDLPDVRLEIPEETEPGFIRVADVELHHGVITAVKALKAKCWRLTLQDDKRENLSFTTDRQTLIYQLSPRNRSLFGQQDKRQQIVQDVNRYRRSLVELKEGQLDLVLESLAQQSTHETVRGAAEEKSERGAQSRSLRKERGAMGALTHSQLAFAREEEQRRKNYGMPTTPKNGQNAIVAGKKTSDDTLILLVIEAAPPKIAADKETAADRALGLIQQTIDDGNKDAAKFRLKQLMERYPATRAAKKAEALLETLR